MAEEEAKKTLSDVPDEVEKGAEPTTVANETQEPLPFGALLIVGICMFFTSLLNGFSVIASAILLELLAEDLKLAENNFQWTFNSFLLPLVSESDAPSP